MLIVYTGDGKGKSSACIGQAIRAIGHEMKVGFVQFMKTNLDTGEQKFLSLLLKENFFISGRFGFFTSQKQRERHRQCAVEAVNWIKKNYSLFDMLVLDECLYAHDYGLILDSELADIISCCKEQSSILVLSGRKVPGWVVEKADIVSKIDCIKHCYHRNIPATKGVEY